MDESTQCIRCHTQMECGLIADLTYGSYAQQHWYPGVPTPSIWTGLEVKREQAVAVTTRRCPQCGYLESYAIPTELTKYK